jgi:hypothetical protein
MDILSGLKKDIEEGIKQGVDAVMSTATLVKEKAEELTEKGKTQYHIYELKNKLQKQLADLGGKLHQLAKAKKVKVSNQDLKKLLTGIDKTHAAISKLESKELATAAASSKPIAKKALIKKQKTTVKNKGLQKAKKKIPN